MATSLVNNKYRITRRIGGGSFGEIYMGVGPNNEKVAVKFERHGTRCPQLRHEYKVYRELVGCHGFCQVYHFGQQDNYNVMVMDLLGPSLEDLFNKCNRRFSLKTVLQIADQMLERVDTLHSRHLIHRDIKPANFVIGLGENAANIYCVDFGLSKRYRHPKNLQHIPHRDGRSLTGTPRYASINNHLGIEQSRRDDLESIGYVLIYFLKGSLPWQGLKAKNAQKKYRLILEKKQQVSIAQLCQGCPSQFAEFLAYTRSLKFDAKPDIPYLRKLFRDLYHAQNCGSIPKLWDWDGLDNDYSSTGGSLPPGPGPAGGAPLLGAGPAVSGSGAQPLSSHLRPTTAAAVAAPGAMLGNDDLGMAGMGGADDLDDGDFDGAMHGAAPHRPNTAGAMLQSSYNNPKAAGQLPPGNWGYPRTGQAPQGQAMPLQHGLEDPAANPRRPHTAHGARGPGFAPAPSQQQPQGQPQQGYPLEGEDGHVVAGAREMMRYRRNRGAADGPAGAVVPPGQQPPQQQQLPAGQHMGYAVGGVPAAGAGNNWAVYQQAAQGAKPAAVGGMMPAQQAQAMRKPVAGVPTGATGAQQWSQGYAPAVAGDRPKSATMASNAMPQGTTSAMRPSSGMLSNPSASGVSNPSAAQQQVQQQQWQAQQQAQQQQAGGLSYGALKTRLLPGGAPAPVGGANPAPLASSKPASAGSASGGLLGATSAQPQAANTSSKSKLFSLAR